jgi:DNA-binding MarR family transcriptional regulator
MMPTQREDPIELTMRNWERRGLADALYLGAASSIARAAEIVRLTTEDVMKPYGVSQTRLEILNLLFLSKSGDLPMGKIGSRLFIHPTSVTSAVDGLERKGYVERVPHPVDRRTTLARITPAGRDLVRSTAPAVTATRFGLDALSPDELTELIRLLRKVRQTNGDFDDTDG